MARSSFFCAFSLLAHFNVFHSACFAFQPFTVADKALQGHVFQTLSLPDWMSCIVACQQDARCVSYNYERSSSLPDEHVCELNSAVLGDLCDFEKEKSFLFAKGFVYQQLKASAKQLNCGDEKNESNRNEHEDAIVPCEVHFVKVGCFNDDRNDRALNRSLFTRNPASESKWDWNKYLYLQQNLTCRCAQAAKRNHYTVFGIQHERECWSGPEMSNGGNNQSYAKHGRSEKCFSVTPVSCKDTCDLKDDWPCVGGDYLNFVYSLNASSSSGP